MRKSKDGFDVEVLVESHRGHGTIKWTECIPFSEFEDDMTEDEAQSVIMDYVNETFRNDVWFDVEVTDSEAFREYFDPVNQRERQLLKESEDGS